MTSTGLLVAVFLYLMIGAILVLVSERVDKRLDEDGEEIRTTALGFVMVVTLWPVAFALATAEVIVANWRKR
jgi:hypothetical protein